MIKYVVAVAVFLGLVGAIYYAGHAAGFDSRDKTVAGEIEDAVQREREAQEKAWKKKVELAEGQIVVEEKIVEVIKEVQVEIPKIVKQIVEVKPECAVLPGFGGVLSKQARAANIVRITDGAELAGEVSGDDGVP